MGGSLDIDESKREIGFTTNIYALRLDDGFLDLFSISGQKAVERLRDF